MNVEERILYAKQLRDNPLLPQIFAECKQISIQRWMVSAEAAEREHCWQQMRVYGQFENQLMATVHELCKQRPPSNPEE